MFKLYRRKLNIYKKSTRGKIGLATMEPFCFPFRRTETLDLDSRCSMPAGSLFFLFIIILTECHCRPSCYIRNNAARKQLKRMTEVRRCGCNSTCFHRCELPGIGFAHDAFQVDDTDRISRCLPCTRAHTYRHESLSTICVNYGSFFFFHLAL